MLRLLGLFLCLGLGFGCAEKRRDLPQPVSADSPTSRAALSQAAPAADAGIDPSMAWVAHMGKTNREPAGASTHLVRPAILPDTGYAGEATVPTRRLVYRVKFVLPGMFRERGTALSPEAGELHVDVSDNRLRARFLGAGWPVPRGSEVRIRNDVPGAYVFDGNGGRSLGSGELAAWFDGKEGSRPHAQIRIRRDFSVAQTQDYGPGPLLCALLAEWTNQARDALEPRCRRGAIPPGFRFGPWSAELMAVVPLRLPQHELRADQENPPPEITGTTFGAILSPVEMAALASAAPKNLTDEKKPGSVGPSGLHVRNDSDGRALVLVNGIPIGWVDASTEAEFPMGPGRYQVGAMRPLGLLRLPPKPVVVPASITVPMRQREPELLLLP